MGVISLLFGQLVGIFKNLFDKTYYEYQGVGIQVGEPFTVLGTVSVNF
ncbi:MAG: hypothetical protein KME35_00145 [Aphanocapsa sp. GSE-SYN-MK-11-07L]|jgi:outer membrane receptor protein involved in Fe transport|nr:hypothetical protein [Aphanocapsa sp. GSE-SYN-MK-11-07L]